MEKKFEFISSLEEKIKLLLKKYKEVLNERDEFLEKLIKAEESINKIQNFYEEELSKNSLICDIDNSIIDKEKESKIEKTDSCLKADEKVFDENCDNKPLPYLSAVPCEITD